MKSIKIQVMMSQEQVDILDRMAEERGLSRSALMRSLLMKEQEQSTPKRRTKGGLTTTPPLEIIDH